MGGYIRELSSYISAAGALFLFGGVLGYFSAAANPQDAVILEEDIARTVEPLSEMAPWQFALLIFLNNSLKVFGAMISGVLISLPPIGFLLLNGNLLGVFGFLVSQSRGWPFFFVGLAPHGIVELSAVMVGCAAGLKIGAAALNKIFGRNDGTSILQEIQKAWRLYLRVLLPLFFFAAILEAYLTPLLLSLFFAYG